MAQIIDLDQITGLKLAKLKSFEDQRGRFTEIFRKEWFPERNWDMVQSNRSRSLEGVLRGLHYHNKQADYWFVLQGTIRVGLADLRRSSPTIGQTMVIEMSGEDEQGLFIPVGVAHGFLSLEESLLIYYVDNYYDGSDEFGVAWDDPDLGLSWGKPNPKISERDRANPRLKEIPVENRPK